MDIESIIKHGQRIAAEVNCTVMFHDLNLLTNGELIVDINTCQVGMQNIHAHVQCMAALTAVVMGIVMKKEKNVQSTHVHMVPACITLLENWPWNEQQ